MYRIALYIISVLLLVSLSGCFTGVESTPKISYSDVKKEKITKTKEEVFLSDIAYEIPTQWKAGKEFYVTDSKIAISLLSNSEGINDEILVDTIIQFQKMYPVKSFTGDDVTELEFLSPQGNRLFYRDFIRYDDLKDKIRLEVPFTIETSVVDAVRSKILGNTYYIITSLWYDENGAKSVNGLRHIPIKVVSVEPGNSIYPIRVVFYNDVDGKNYSVYMTIGNGRTSTRNFNSLFAFDNPKEKYPDIREDIWDLIIHSKVKIGMSRDECRLALGTPLVIGQRPTTAGMVEYWSYNDGVYLLFEDGLLSSYRK